MAAFAFLWQAATHKKIKTGIEILKKRKLQQLEGLRIGLVTNPTGVDNNLVSDVDLLHRAANVKLVALFGPEHGVRGSSHAGDAVGNDSDPATGLPVFSLTERITHLLTRC